MTNFVSLARSLRGNRSRTAVATFLAVASAAGSMDSPAAATYVAPQDDPPPGAATEAPARRSYLRLPPAVLLDRSYYDDYELATFSLLRGIREDPTGQLVHNDWELQFSRGEFRVNMVTDDRSLIADLTAVGPHELAVALDWDLEFTERAVEVHEGHTYVILTRDSDSELASVIHVEEFVPGRRCTLQWLSTDGSGRAQGSLRDEHVGDLELSQVLEMFRAAPKGNDPLTEPRARLQVRSGAIGGNPCRISLSGTTSAYVRERSEAPLDVSGEVALDEPPTAYFEGGSIPRDRTFVVTRVEYRGSARGDANGKGQLRVVVAGQELVSIRNAKEPIDEVWKGELRLRSGDEMDTFLTVSNSSAGEVLLEGRFEDDALRRDGRSWAANPGFFEDVTQAVAAALEARRVLLSTPDIVLQVRAGAGGGNPNRIDLRGRTSGYVDHLRQDPLDFSERVTMDTPSEAYFVGGSIPRGKVFVVTRVDYAITAAGDSNGGGYVKLTVGGRAIVDVAATPGRIEDRWRGRLILRPDEESRTYLEVGNSSTADVTIQGFLQ